MNNDRNFLGNKISTISSRVERLYLLARNLLLLGILVLSPSFPLILSFCKMIVNKTTSGRGKKIDDEGFSASWNLQPVIYASLFLRSFFTGQKNCSNSPALSPNADLAVPDRFLLPRILFAHCTMHTDCQSVLQVSLRDTFSSVSISKGW